MLSNYVCFTDGGGDNIHHRNFYGSFKVYKDDVMICHESRFDLPDSKSSNGAEYEALLNLLDYFLGADLNIDDTILILSDSKLMLNQISTKWKVNSESLSQFCFLAREEISILPCKVILEYAPRINNLRELGH